MKYLFVVLGVIAAPCQALLPPVWQGIAEVKAIINDPRLRDYLNSGEVLEGITRKDTGWVIHTNQSQVKVEVVPLPQSMPGPEKFDLRFTTEVPLQKQIK